MTIPEGINYDDNDADDYDYNDHDDDHDNDMMTISGETLL